MPKTSRPAKRRPGAAAPIQHMTEHDVDRVIHLLAHWPEEKKYGKLTWERLIARLAMSGPSWTRQALFARAEVAGAFQRAKDEIKGVAPKKRLRPVHGPVEELLEAKITSLKAEVNRLEQVLRDYDERFIRYQFNAQGHGMTAAELNMPLPKSPHGSPNDRPRGKTR